MPFGMSNLPPAIPHNGVKYKAMIGPSAFINPGPAISGNITKLYLRKATGGINSN